MFRSLRAIRIFAFTRNFILCAGFAALLNLGITGDISYYAAFFGAMMLLIIYFGLQVNQNAFDDSRIFFAEEGSEKYMIESLYQAGFRQIKGGEDISFAKFAWVRFEVVRFRNANGRTTVEAPEKVANELNALRIEFAAKD